MLPGPPPPTPPARGGEQALSPSPRGRGPGGGEATSASPNRSTLAKITPLLATQTLGAINDNLFKNALVVLVLFQAGAQGPALAAASGGVFIAPYILLSATAGQLADRFEKRRMILWVKAAEIAIMATAAAALLLGSIPLLFLVLFALGVHATIFGPLKYAILPDHLPPSELLAGNGLIEAGTFLGILAGTIAGGALATASPAYAAAAGLVVAVAGLATARAIRHAPASAPGLRIDWNVLAATAALLRTARADRPVWHSLLAISWFWAVGATVLAELPVMVRDTLQADGHVLTLLLALFSIGVGAGSIGASRLLRGRASARLVPWAALGLGLFAVDLALAVHSAGPLPTPAALLGAPAGWRIGFDLLALAACGGLYSVPLYALLQLRSPEDRRARTIAANNVVNAVAIVIAAALTAACAAAGLGPMPVLLATGALNLAAAALLVRLRNTL